MQDKVILETKSPTIRRNAQKILGYDEDRIKAFGVAFISIDVRADDTLGVKDNKSM
jgi:hypothetical protein